MGWGQPIHAEPGLPASLSPPSRLGKEELISVNQLSLQAGARVRLKLIWAWSGPSAKISLPHLPSKGIYLLQGDFHAQRNCSEVTLILKLIFDFTE